MAMTGRLAMMLCAALLTAGCAVIGARPAPTAALVPGPVTLPGPVELTPPSGLCVAPAASRLPRGFAMLGACTPGEGAPVVISVQLGAPGSAVVNDDPPALAAFLKTETGRETLSRTGRASDITVKSTRVDGGQVRALYARHPEGDEWRGFADVGDRLVTVSLRAVAPGAITAARGDRLLSRALAGLRVAGNP